MGKIFKTDLPIRTFVIRFFYSDTTR